MPHHRAKRRSAAGALHRALTLEPHAPANLYGALKERLRTSDKQGEIDLYYELISSGHSVGEILTAATSAGREVATPSDDLGPLRLGKFPRIARWIAFGVVYTAVVSSVSIAGFSTMHGGRDAQDQVGNADPASAPKPSQTAGPNSTLSAPALKAEAGVQEAVVAGRPEADASQGSEPGRSDGIAKLVEKLDHQAAKTPDPIPLVVRLPAAAPGGSAETTLHFDAAQSDAGQPLDATHRDAAKGAATVPTENGSAALPLRAHAAKTRASAPRRYAEPKRRVSQRTPAKDPHPVSNAQPPESYTSSARGYGYGGPAPNSETGS